MFYARITWLLATVLQGLVALPVRTQGTVATDDLQFPPGLAGVRTAPQRDVGPAASPVVQPVSILHADVRVRVQLIGHARNNM